MRKESGSVVCPECGRLVDVEEKSCPHCGRWQPGMFGYGPALLQVFGEINVTQILFWACLILYALSLALDPSGAWRNSLRGEFLGILAPSDGALRQLGMTGGQIVKQFDRWWTPLSATFLHGGVLHIFFNMWWLRMLGPPIEESLGPARFFLLYMGCGAGGFLLSNGLSAAPTVGASGAIFGLLAATIIIGRESGTETGRFASQQAIGMAALLFVFGLVSARTNNWAHLGGFLVGIVVTRALVSQARRAEGPLVQAAALVLGLATVGSVLATFLVVRF